MNNEGFEKRIFLAFLISSIFILVSYYFMPKPGVNEVNAHTELVETNTIVKKESFVEDIKFEKKLSPTTNRISNGKLFIDIDSYGGRIIDLYIDGDWNQSKSLIKLYWQENNYFTFDTVFGELENTEKLDKPVYKVKEYISNKLTLETEFNYKGNKLLLTREYNLLDGYLINYETKIKNLSKSEITLNYDGKSLSIPFSFGLASTNEKNAQAMLVSDYFINKKPKKVLTGGLFKKREKVASVLSPLWMSVHNSYFIATAKPEFTNYNAKFLLLKEEKLYSEIAFGVEIPAISILPNEEKSYKIQLYIGPKNEKELVKIDNSYKKLFSWPAAFNWFMKPMEIGLFKLAHIIASLVKNWGITIILLALIIKLILSPLSIQAAISIKKSNLLQPKLKKLQEKYRDDPNILNQKVAELYRQEKVNPLGGCLPLLLQFPVFFVLYRVLSTSVELKGANFLWIKDLTMPDTLFHVSLPFIAFNFNLLPILMTIVQIFQMRIQSLRNPAAQKEQQIINNYILPIFFLFIFWNMPSGLVLYWTVQNVFSIIEQEIINIDRKVKL